MSGFTSAKAKLTFAGADYQCLQTYQYGGTLNVAKAECSGANGAVTLKASGASDNTLSVDMVVPKINSHTFMNAFVQGAAGALTFYPEEDASGGLTIAATNAIVQQCNLSGGTSAFNIASVMFELDDRTFDEVV